VTTGRINYDDQHTTHNITIQSRNGASENYIYYIFSNKRTLRSLDQFASNMTRMCLLRPSCVLLGTTEADLGRKKV